MAVRASRICASGAGAALTRIRQMVAITKANTMNFDIFGCGFRGTGFVVALLKLVLSLISLVAAAAIYTTWPTEKDDARCSGMNESQTAKIRKPKANNRTLRTENREPKTLNRCSQLFLKLNSCFVCRNN